MADIRELVQATTPPVDDLDLPALHLRAATVRARQRRQQRVGFSGLAGVLVLVLVLTASPLLRGRSGPAEVAIGQVPPSPLAGISGPSLLGEGEISLGDFAGQPVLLYVWASWCGPCSQVLPDLQALASYQPDLAVVTIAVDDVAARARATLDDADVDLPSMLLADREPLSTALDGTGALGDTPLDVGEALPVVIALDADHDVVSVVFGAPDAVALRALADSAHTGVQVGPSSSPVPSATPEFPIMSVPATPSPGMPNIVPSPLPDPGIRTYEVQPGDTLSTIAEAVYGDPLAFAPIAEANDLGGDNSLQVGEALLIPDRSVPADPQPTAG